MFPSNGGLSQCMVEARLVGFVGLQTTTLSTSASVLGLLTNATTSTFTDTFNYTAYSQNPISR